MDHLSAATSRVLERSYPLCLFASKNRPCAGSAKPFGQECMTWCDVAGCRIAPFGL